MMRVEFIQEVAKAGLRVFEKHDIEGIFATLGLSPTYMKRMLRIMASKEQIIALGKGLYTLPTELLPGGPLHPYEIGLKLAKVGVISHRSALSYHGLTDQVMSRIYVTVPRHEGANLSQTKEYQLNNTRYFFTRVAPKNYWGSQQVFIGEARIEVTNLEKTLIDGLQTPAYCGGFRDVLFAYERGLNKASPNQLLDYAKQTSLVVCKRLGWVCEQLGEFTDLQDELAALIMPYYQRLDVTGSRHGRYNKRWNLVENI
jgi:predicted transcriptional regulator of viral defense system